MVDAGFDVPGKHDDYLSWQDTTPSYQHRNKNDMKNDAVLHSVTMDKLCFIGIIGKLYTLSFTSALNHLNPLL